ncbi:glycosyltransferase [Microcella indica]|uniref:glycosyltransferase n=1 Tax=Microcella indica TaxID=2750620 RepID=UPI0015CF6359|nr:hypothetical protein [Microcella indica]
MSRLKRVAGHVIRALPEALVGRLLPGEYRYRPADIPAPSRAPDTPVRLYIAPANFAGQAWQWARAAERHLPGVGAVSMVEVLRAGFRHPADTAVPRGVYAASGRWQGVERAVVARDFTHLIVEAERWPFGGVLLESVDEQVQWALDRGLHVAMLCHGSDIRLPSRHAELEADSPFRTALGDQIAHYQRLTECNRALLDRLDLPVFVSTPDLLRDVPQATWLPVVVDVDRWATDAAPLSRAVPRVVHAPSRAAMKGSELVEPTLHRLHEQGLIDYRRLEKLPHEGMVAAYRDADIVLDQFSMGIYGVAACEAMAAGRVVVSHVADFSRETVLAATSQRLPIVQARAAELETVLRGLLDDREAARATAALGPDFVRAVHDGRRSAQVLGPFLLG